MKNSLFLYLFIIALLMNVFTYKYFTSQNKDETTKLRIENKKLNDSLLVTFNKSIDDNVFSLEYNDRAQNYLNQNDLSGFSEKVKQALLAFNDDKEGNRYIDQGRVGEQKFIINKFVNNRQYNNI